MYIGAVTQLMTKHNVRIRGSQPEIHRNRVVVERFNRTLEERLLGYQYAKELENPHKRNRELVKRLSEVLKALNAEMKKPPPIVTRKAGAPICPTANVRYLYQPGELEGGKKRALDQIWSVGIHKIDYHIVTQDIRVYYLKAPAPKRGFVKEELLIVPGNTSSRMHMS